MIRVLSATLLLLGMSMPASAKVLCPPGRFTLHPTDARAPALDGLELVLGEGKVAITGTCPAVKAGDFHRPSGKWLLRVRARWSRCGGRSFALRARFDLQDAAYCTRLEGALRLGNGRRIPVAADRIPECGNGLREVGEQCDEGVDTACCGLDCRIKPGCLVACDLRDFPCAADEICVHTCGAGGVCKPRSEVYCGGWPVCDCNQQVTYSNRCAAYEAGTGYLYAGPCRRPCSPHRPDDCSPIEFCTALSENDCAKW